MTLDMTLDMTSDMTLDTTWASGAIDREGAG